VSLSGNLGFVPIDEVLRLLTRSRQQGSVDVTGNGLHGRVFVGKGGIDLATTSDNDDLHRHLVNSGYADEKALNRITTGETTLAAMTESNQALIDLIREMTVESLFQIADRGDEFKVFEGATTPYASPKSFELEALLHDTDERKREWHKVAEVVPDLAGAITFRRDLGEREEVTVKVDDWKVLSEIGTGSSVVEIADHLGTTEFWTARVAARLVKNDLVLLRTPASEPAVVADDEVSYEPEEYVAPADEYAAYETEKTPEADETERTPEADEADFGADEDEAPVFEPASADEADEDLDPNQSWWQEPKEEAVPVEDDESRAPAVVAEGLSEIPAVEDSDDESDVEEDTEAFLEKVFSELDSSEPETEEGHGLLRRRRMGTLRDFSSDS